MKKNTLFSLFCMLVLVTLTACGRFYVSKPTSLDTLLTPTPQDQTSGDSSVIESDNNVFDPNPPQLNFSIFL